LWILSTTDLSVQEPKSPDYIICHDFRDHLANENGPHGLPKRLDSYELFVFDMKFT
jgi:hypothetical protein